MLTRLHELQAAEAELAAHSAALAGAQQALHSMAAAAKEHAKYELYAKHQRALSQASVYLFLSYDAGLP